MPDDTPVPATPVVDYSTPQPHNRYAARAMVFGLLGFLPFIPGILAIRYGRRGLRDADDDPRLEGRGQAKAGIWLGVGSVVIWAALAIAAVPALANARRSAIRVRCLSNLRQIGMASMTYAAGNSGRLPASIDDMIRTGPLTAGIFQCPACAGDPSKPPASSGAFGPYSYVYLGGGRKLQAIRSASTEPLAYEPLTNHDDPGINVLYADGHAEVLNAAQAQAFLQKYGTATSTQPTSQSVEK